jgi:hypothetical protein
VPWKLRIKKSSLKSRVQLEGDLEETLACCSTNVFLLQRVTWSKRRSLPIPDGSLAFVGPNSVTICLCLAAMTRSFDFGTSEGEIIVEIRSCCRICTLQLRMCHARSMRNRAHSEKQNVLDHNVICHGLSVELLQVWPLQRALTLQLFTVKKN